MQNHSALQVRALALIVQLRQSLIAPAFWGRHRRRSADFTRECVLTFPVLMLLLLQKSLKSLQTHAQEFFSQLRQGLSGPCLSAGAVTHARAKLCPSAFVELNQAVLHTVYGPAHADLVRRWHGHRLLGVDSALVRLPSHAAVGKKFGWVQCANHHGLQDRYPQGRVSVLYDVLNAVALEARLVASTVAETELAHEHLAAVQPGDLLLNDRGFTGYRWLVAVRAVRAQFVSRCSRRSFAAVQHLFARNEAGVSVVVPLAAPPEVRAECRARGWPLEVRVRLVTVRLKSGELEVLATSLLDPAAYPTEALAAVYWQRWGHETYYGRLKGRLDLEHASGQTVAAVEQGLSRDDLVEQRGERGDRPGAGAIGRSHGGAPPPGAGESGGERACAQVSVDRVVERPGAGGAGIGGTDRVVSGQSGQCAPRAPSAPTHVLALALLSLPTASPKAHILTMKSLFQR
jgi:hypothetical protein